METNFDDVIELEVDDLTEGGAAAGTTNTGGTFGTATCPSTLGTSFSFTD